MEGRDGSWGEAVQAIASLDCGDGALEVRAIQELSELEQAMTQHKELQEERATKCTRTVIHKGYHYSVLIIIFKCTKNYHMI